MRRKSVLCVLVAIMSLWACNEENSEISAELFGDDIPLVSNVGSSIDTRYSLSDSQSKTDNLSTAFLGTINDYDFGYTSAACAMQLRISTDVYVEKPASADEFAIDSVCLDIKFDLKISMYDSIGYKTKTLPLQNVKVFSLLKSISDKKSFVDVDDSYFKSIGNGSFNYTKPDTVTYKMRYHGGEGNSSFKEEGYMRMKLDKSYGEELLGGDRGDYVNQEAFINKFHGIAIAPQSNNSGEGLFNFNPKTTIITVHYRKGISGKQDTLFVPFYVNTNSVKIAKYAHSHKAEIVESIKLENQNKQASRLYVQGGSGLKAMIHFPQALIDTSFIAEGSTKKALRDINKAEIVLPIITPKNLKGEEIKNKYLNIPEKLVMVGFNKDNEIVALTDYMSNKAFFNGFYNIDKKEYRFNIANLLQYMIDNTEKNFYEITKIDISKGFAIYPDNRRANPRRVILDGESIKFNITYTDLKNK